MPDREHAPRSHRGARELASAGDRKGPETARRLPSSFGDLLHIQDRMLPAASPLLRVLRLPSHATLLSTYSRGARHRRHMPSPVRRP